MCHIIKIIEIEGKKYAYESRIERLSRSQCDIVLNKASIFFDSKRQNSSSNFFDNLELELQQKGLKDSNFKSLLKLSDYEYNILKNCMYNWHLHFTHSFFVVYLTDLMTGKAIKRVYTITTKSHDITKKKTLIEEADTYHKVTKIADNLYITNHGWICDIDSARLETKNLEFQQSYYDEDLDCYVTVDKYSGKLLKVTNVTLQRHKQLDDLVINKLLKNNEQLDITSMLYTSDQLLAYKLLKSGFFSNNEYTQGQIKKFTDILNEYYKYEHNVNAVDKIYDIEILNKKNEEEL